MAVASIDVDGFEFGEQFMVTEIYPEVRIQEVEPLYEVKEGLPVVNVPILFLNILAQHRMGRNERQGDLNASIEADINDGKPAPNYPIDITSFDRDTLEEYLEFTNRIWGANKSIDNFIENQPGRYLVIISGHSRLESFHAYAEKYDIPKDSLGARCQFKNIKSVDEFLHEQIKENIHSAPPPERAARGYAEAFLYARNNNPRLSKKEFCRQNGISAGKLSESLLYAELPPVYRELTDSGKLKFSVSVELGRALPWLIKDAEAFLESKGHPKETIEEAINDRVEAELNRYVSLHNERFKRHVTNTRTFICHEVDQIKKRFGVEQKTEEFTMELFDARLGQNDTEVVLQEVARSLGRLQITSAVEQRDLHNRISELIERADLEIDPNSYRQLQEIGQAAINATQQTLL